MSNISLTFAMFHYFKDDGGEWLDRIAMTADSIHRVYPAARIVLMTNDRTVAGLPGYLERFPVDGNPDELMLLRLRSYRAFVESHQTSGHIVLLDTDMLLVRSISGMLQDDVDVALTLRNYPSAPVNGGLYVLNLNNKQRVQAFLDGLLTEFDKLDRRARYWDGDQTVVASMLSPPVKTIDQPLSAIWQDVRLRYFPVKVYNHTPRSLQLKLGLISPQARLLHLKGYRKRFMKRYHNRYVAGLLGILRRLDAAQNS